MRTPSSGRRSLKLAAVTTAVVASSLSIAPTALAAAPASAVAPLAAQYNSGGCSASLNATVVVRGTSFVITVRSSGGAVVKTLVINSTPSSLPVVPAANDGVSNYTVGTASLELGAHTAAVTCSDGISQSLPFTVIEAQASGVPAGGASTSAGGSTGGGGLAFTGANAVVPLGAIGVVLILGGTGAVVSSRRRRDDAA